MSDAGRAVVPVLLGVALGVVAVAALALWLLRGPKSVTVAAPATDAPADETGLEDFGFGVPTRRAIVELVYPDGRGGWLREERVVALPDDDARRVHAVLQVWLMGSRRGGLAVLSPGRVLMAFVEGNERAYLSLSPEAVRGFKGGLSAEVEVLTAMARTFEANFPNIREFQLLVQGEPLGTLGGQLDLSGPLSVSYFARLAGGTAAR
jgi:hypothetical protein